MTMLLILGAGIAAFAIFIAGCFVGHRTGRNEGSDSALRWCAHYESSKYGESETFTVRTHGDQDE